MNVATVFMTVIVVAIGCVMVWALISKSKSKLPTQKKVRPEMVGVRICTICGIKWKSSYGVMKDSGFLNNAIGGTYDPENLAGLTCSRCDKSFCKQHLQQEIPRSLPGGRCPSCGGTMDLA
jgi:hypothetical protein